jgi:hypothetical protein
MDAVSLLTLASAAFLAYGSYTLALRRGDDTGRGDDNGWIFLFLGFAMLGIPLGFTLVFEVIATLFTGHWPRNGLPSMALTLSTVGLWLVALAGGFITGRIKKG